jgi:4-hydroxybenzoate polyprenyltransferase
VAQESAADRPGIGCSPVRPRIGRNLLVAFVCFSVCASGGYVLIDLLDLKADREHPRKRRRTFASGQLSLRTGAVLVGLTWLGGVGLAAATMPLAFEAVTGSTSSAPRSPRFT